MSAIAVYEVLAKSFLHEGVDTCFGLLGDANMHWASAMESGGCEFTYVRDEHCAVAAAMAWARFTGKVGIATVTCGPGITQILTALPAAVRANIPLVVFAGEAPLHRHWYNQAIDQRPFIEACGAQYESLHEIETMQSRIREAFVKARQNQCPVVVGVPFDLQEQMWDGVVDLLEPAYTAFSNGVTDAPDTAAINTAMALIADAKKIVLLAGRGAVLSHAAESCTELADCIDALLATTLPARGLFWQDPFCIGIAGGFSTELARECLTDADLVIAVGCRLAQHTSDSGKLFDSEKVLHIDVSPRPESQGRVASKHQMCADAKLGVEALVAAVKSDSSKSLSGHPDGMKKQTWRTPELADRIKTSVPDSAAFDIEPDLLDPRDVVAQLDQALPADWTMVNSSGHCSYFFAHMPNRPVESFLTIREFGAIGNGVAFAIGAARARPDTPVVLLDGDGSFLMHIQELETIVRHDLNIIVCVMNDGAYGSEIHKLRAEGLSDQGAVFGRRDFANIGKGFDVGGTVVRGVESLKALLSSVQSMTGPAIWDFHVSDKVVSPVVRRSQGS